MSKPKHLIFSSARLRLTKILGVTMGVRRDLGLGVVQRKRWGRVFLSQSLVSALRGLCAHPSPGPP